MKNNFYTPFAEYRTSDPQRFWKDVCAAVSDQLQSIRSDEKQMFITDSILMDLIYNAYKKGQPFPLHAVQKITSDDNELVIEKHHFAFSYDDLVTPCRFAYTAYLPLENGSIYPCLITDNLFGKLYFDVFSPHCMADYAERVWQVAFSSSKSPKRKKEEHVFSCEKGMDWMRHFMFYNQHYFTDKIKAALSKAQQQLEHPSLVTIFNEGFTYSQAFEYPYIVIHTSFLPYVRNGEKCRLDDDQLRSIRPFLDKVRWLDEGKAFVLT